MRAAVKRVKKLSGAAVEAAVHFVVDARREERGHDHPGEKGGADERQVPIINRQPVSSFDRGPRK